MARTKIFPSLWYTKDAEAAARLYASIFPNSRVDKVTSLMSESPSGPPGSVSVVNFTLFGQRFMSGGDPVRSKKVTDALLKMIKLDIATLEKAYRS